MDHGIQRQSARCAEWVIRRNPAYLLSAALMAVGARLYLVNPEDAAGDVGVMLLTLGVLQTYEWAVGGILLLLHRTRRSLEDRPSLLLVATLFWTGPLAATIEMTAWRPQLGTGLAAGACVIALAELRLVCRALGLRLSPAGQAVGAACVMLLAAAPPLLKVSEATPRTNELYLYGAWWILGGIVLMALGSVRVYRRGRPPSRQPQGPGALGGEILFLAITTGATACHLVGMNHGFYCHAVAFYASPFIVAASIVAMDYLSLMSRPSRWLIGACATLPGGAVLLATRPFDPEVPLMLLPRWLHDPMLSVLLIAAAAWWFGYVRHRITLLLHAGNVGLGAAAYRVLAGLAGDGAVAGPLPAGLATARDLWVVALYVVAGYLLVSAWLRRSRIEALGAVIVHHAAVTLLVLNRTPAGGFIISLLAGWSVLIGLHLATRRPRLWARLVPVAFLLIVPWTYDADPLLQWPARAHAASLIVALFIAGYLWRWTHYRPMAGALVAAQIVFVAGQWAAEGQHSAAVTVVGIGFLVLAGGALISWHKQNLLDRLSRPKDKERPEETGT